MSGSGSSHISQTVLVTEQDAEPQFRPGSLPVPEQGGRTELLPVVPAPSDEETTQFRSSAIPPSAGALSADQSSADGLLGQFLRDPGPFSFDAAILLMLRAHRANGAGSAIRFRAPLGTAYPAADVASVSLGERGFVTTVTPMGLTGPAGVLPLHYSAELVSEHRLHSSALSDFLEMLSQRPLAQFAESGIKYRLASSHTLPEHVPAADYARTVRKTLMALSGFYSPDIAPLLGVDPGTVNFYSGYFSTMPRSADRLKALLSDWLGLPVRMEEFTPLWVHIPPDQQSFLPLSGPGGSLAESFSQLGVDAAAGARYLDCQSQFTVRIGPVDWKMFQALMPSGGLYGPLLKLIRTFVGSELQIMLRPVLKKDAVPLLQLPTETRASSPRLGWSSWLSCQAKRKHDADEPVFTERHVDMAGNH
ncbi:MAG: type VI secretion system baseplate subunit TssG [Acetobacter aceti]